MHLPRLFGTYTTCLSLLFILFCITELRAQDNAQGDQFEYEVERSFVRKLGHTKPLRDVLPRTPTDALKLRDYKANKPHYVRNFVGRRPSTGTLSSALPKGVDPVLNGGAQRDGGIVVEPQVNVQGMSFDDVSIGIPDPNGDVSSQYYVQMVNQTYIQVYDLQGNEVGDMFHANTIWNQVGFTSSGDPIILYDKDVNRWFITEFPPSNRVLIAVSDTEDPMGAWTAYAFTTPSFPDYPKYGIWSNAYVLTTNESSFEGTVKFYAINRQDILSGEDTVRMQRFVIPRLPEPSWQTPTPVHWTGDMPPADDTKPMIMRINDDGWGATIEDKVEIYEMDINWNDENSTVITQIDVPTAPFDADFCSEQGFGFACVPQPNGTGIDGIPWVIMHKAQYRRFSTHSSLVVNFTVDASGDDDGGIRWIEFRKIADEDWWVYQEGTYGTTDGENRFMGAISMDSQGNIGLGFTVSSETTFPSLRFTGRMASDPLGQMTVEEFECATGTGSNAGPRFGDYASMSVDDQDMFWFTAQYVLENGDWASRIVGFKLDRSELDIGPTALLSPISAPDLDEENVRVAIQNQGIQPQTTFAIGYSFEGGDPVLDTINTDPLLTDSVYIHTFEEMINFGPFGDYSLDVFTILDSDENAVNDTCRFTVVKQTLFDASVSNVVEVPRIVCDTFIGISVVLENIGVNTLTSATLHWSANDGPEGTFGWNGSLDMGASEVIPLVVGDLVPGDNTIRFYVSEPNAMPDQNVLNDTLEVETTAIPGGDKVTLNLLTDLFPEETSWELRDIDGVVLFSDGPLQGEQEEIVEEWCLDPESCYTFVLFDSFGDGIQAYGVEGDFQITNSTGQIIALLDNANFGDSLVTDFCLDFTCGLVANAFTAHESEPGANDGLISITALGGNPPVMFSVNNGPFQTSPIYNNLSPGIYTIRVVDNFKCEAEITRTILSCNTQVMTHVTHASDQDAEDGSILISTENSSGPVQYSINGGNSFQVGPLFENLSPDTFYIVVRDSVNCEVTDTVIVSFESALTYTTYGHLIKVYPNPSEGAFYFHVEGLQDIFLRYEIIDAHGRIVQRGEAGSFSGVIKGAFGLYSEPPGMYFLRFRHKELDRMVRLVKQ